MFKSARSSLGLAMVFSALTLSPVMAQSSGPMQSVDVSVDPQRDFCSVNQQGWTVRAGAAPSGASGLANDATGAVVLVDGPQHGLTICRVVPVGDLDVVVVSQGEHGTSQMVEIFSAIVFNRRSGRQESQTIAVGTREAGANGREEFVTWHMDGQFLFASDQETRSMIRLPMFVPGGGQARGGQAGGGQAGGGQGALPRGPRVAQPPRNPGAGRPPRRFGSGQPPRGTNPGQIIPGRPRVGQLPRTGNPPRIPGVGRPPIVNQGVGQLPPRGGVRRPGVNPPRGPRPVAGGQRPQRPIQPIVPQTDYVTLPALMWPVGQNPEGMVSDGQQLWVAESGQRRIAQVDMASGRVTKRTRVGRLPVDMTVTSDGVVHTIVATDQTIWSQSSRRKGKRFARLKDYPDAMVGDDEALWVLVWPDGNSGSSKVVRLEQRNGDALGSPILAKNGSDLVNSRGVIWVVHSFGPDGGQISKLDPYSLDDLGSIGTTDAVSLIDANRQGLYVAGGVWDQSGAVVKIDQNTGQETARVADLGQFIYSMAVTDEHIIAAGYTGQIYILSARDLSVLREISLDIGEFQPGTILPIGDTLFITTSKGRGENGSILVVDNWQPR